MSAPNRPSRPPGAAIRDRRRRRWLTVLIAVAAASATWALAVPVLGVELTVRTGSQMHDVTVLAVVATALGAGLAGWLLLAVLERWTYQARLEWRVVAALVLLVSFLGPLAAVNVAATAVLSVLHCLVAGVLIIGLPSASERPPRSSSHAGVRSAGETAPSRPVRPHR